MSTLAIRNGRIIDPALDRDEVADLFIADGRIVRPCRADKTLDATGLLVVPGLIDLHVHLREPGKAAGEAAETVATGAAAALAGGFTTVVCMPNTTPALDCPDMVDRVRALAEAAQGARVEISACITAGRAGGELADIAALAQAGVVALTDDGSGVADATLMHEAMLLARVAGLPIMDHAEEPTLSADGVINAGEVAEQLGLPGMPAEAETVMIARDIGLARLTGARLHIQHISTAQGVDLVRRAKARGLPVTAEVCPHHFALTDEACLGGDAIFKMNPPLRRAEDVAAVVAGLADGTIDVIASDHAPHTAEDKARGFRDAPCGVIGLETTVPVVWRELVEPGYLTEYDAIALLAANPAEIIGSERGTLAEGAPADVTLIDPETDWVIDPDRFRSKSRNCPFAGWDVKARAVAVVIDGRLVRLEDASWS